MNLINTNIFKSVVTTAKAKAAQHPAWVSAIEKAAAELLDVRTYVVFDKGVLIIQSPTSKKLYRVDDAHTCEAIANGRKACKHLAARRLMIRYYEALDATPSAEVTAPATTAPSTFATRQAKRDAAVLVKPSQRVKGETYGGIDI